MARNNRGGASCGTFVHQKDRRALTSAARIGPVPGSPPVPVASRFVAAGELFDLEYAGGFIRIWCRACDKFEHLSDDRAGTVDAAQSVHRCGARTSDWVHGDLGVRE